MFHEDLHTYDISRVHKDNQICSHVILEAKDDIFLFLLVYEHERLGKQLKKNISVFIKFEHIPYTLDIIFPKFDYLFSLRI